MGQAQVGENLDRAWASLSSVDKAIEYLLETYYPISYWKLSDRESVTMIFPSYKRNVARDSRGFNSLLKVVDDVGGGGSSPPF